MQMIFFKNESLIVSILLKWSTMSHFELTVDSESCLKLVLLKQNFIHGFLNWGEVEVGLSYNYVGVSKVHLKKVVVKSLR